MDLSMIKQARELKSKLEETQKELDRLEVTAESGKGAVKVTANGQQQILSISISPSVIDPDQPDKLEQLVLKAVHDAQAKSQKIASKRMRGLTGGLKVPGLF
jgi:DNA-binding YbaB/EbfC family protein